MSEKLCNPLGTEKYPGIKLEYQLYRAHQIGKNKQKPRKVRTTKANVGTILEI